MDYFCLFKTCLSFEAGKRVYRHARRQERKPGGRQEGRRAKNRRYGRCQKRTSKPNSGGTRTTLWNLLSHIACVCRLRHNPGCQAISTANLRTKILDFRGFDSSRILI